MEVVVSPSLSSANSLHLDKKTEMINKSKADWLHMDVVDGVFAPNVSFGFPVLEAVGRACKKPMDIHFMIVHPESYIQQATDTGAAIMNIQYEACVHLHRATRAIHVAGVKAGVAFNPSAPVDVLEDIIGDVDIVQLMSVSPGSGGQKFIESGIKKAQCLRQLVEREGSNALIEVDGGVQANMAPRLVEAGVDALTSGSYVFRAADPKTTIHSLKQLHK